MPKEPDKYFEEQLKQAADAYDPPCPEEAWLAMEALLDEPPGRRQAIIQNSRLLDDLFLLMTILVFLFLPLKNSSPGKLTAETSETLHQKAITGVIAVQRHDVEMDKPKHSGETVIAEEMMANDQGKPSASAKKTANLQAATIGADQPQVRNSNLQSVFSPANQQQAVTARNMPGHSTDIMEKPLAIRDQYSRLQFTKAPYIELGGEQSPSVQFTYTVPSVAAAKPKQINSPGLLKKFTLTPFATSEWTTAKSGSAANAGIGGGALLGYRINNKITIQAGFAFSRKLYNGGYDTYNAPGGSYWSMVDIYSLEADCEIWEFPIRAAYTIRQKRKSSIYATAGIAAALMKKERYDIYYKRPNGQYANATPEYKSKKMFPLAAMQLGAGYQYSITPNISLVAEPFIKLPLSGVGEGKIKLHSAGIQAGVSYQFR